MSESVLIAGGSGSIGRYLAGYLKDCSYTVKSLTRNKKRSNASDDFLHWDPDQRLMDLEGFVPEHVINLSGAGIADQRWSQKRKALIINSRTESTTVLINSLEEKEIDLHSFISASAVGYYGHTGDRVASEDDEPFTKEFLSEVCQLWETAAARAHTITNRSRIIRISTVLVKNGGALDKMDKTIPYGMANYLGNGKQYLPWIHISDLCGFIHHCMLSSSTGLQTYNVASPHEVTNYQFTQTLRDVINPKAILAPAPKLSIQLLFGEMSRVVLNSTRVNTDKIVNSGYAYQFIELKKALEDIYKT